MKMLKNLTKILCIILVWCALTAIVLGIVYCREHAECPFDENEVVERLELQGYDIDIYTDGNVWAMYVYDSFANNDGKTTTYHIPVAIASKDGEQIQYKDYAKPNSDGALEHWNWFLREYARICGIQWNVVE